MVIFFGSSALSISWEGAGESSTSITLVLVGMLLCDWMDKAMKKKKKKK
jgi:hypothetical protein